MRLEHGFTAFDMVKLGLVLSWMIPDRSIQYITIDSLLTYLVESAFATHVLLAIPVDLCIGDSCVEADV